MNLAWYLFRFKKGACRKFGLFCALLLAASYSAATPSISVGRIKNALFMWIDFWSKPYKSTRNQYYRRLRACHRCPIFNSTMNTCGSPLSKNKELGCFCEMRFKSSIADATCWLNDFSDGSSGFGWKET
jgi:hypothetical protein